MILYYSRFHRVVSCLKPMGYLNDICSMQLKIVSSKFNVPDLLSHYLNKYMTRRRSVDIERYGDPAQLIYSSSVPRIMGHIKSGLDGILPLREEIIKPLIPPDRPMYVLKSHVRILELLAIGSILVRHRDQVKSDFVTQSLKIVLKGLSESEAECVQHALRLYVQQMIQHFPALEQDLIKILSTHFSWPREQVDDALNHYLSAFDYFE